MSPCRAVEELLAAHALGALEPSEEALVREHLGGCEACRAADVEARAHLALVVAPSVDPPDAVWARIQARLAAARAGDDPVRDAPFEDAVGHDGAPSLVLSVNCSFCRSGLERPDAVYCASCLAPHHPECFREHGRCSVMGCGETRVVRPTEQPERLAAPVRLGKGKPAPGRRRRFVVWGGLVAAMTGGAVAALSGRGHEGDVAAATSAAAPLPDIATRPVGEATAALVRVDVDARDASLAEVLDALRAAGGPSVVAAPEVADLLVQDVLARHATPDEVIAALARALQLEVVRRDEPRKHVVVAGDTLLDIAAREYAGAGVEPHATVDRILEANDLGRDAHLLPGVELKLPIVHGAPPLLGPRRDAALARAPRAGTHLRRTSVFRLGNRPVEEARSERELALASDPPGGQAVIVEGRQSPEVLLTYVDKGFAWPLTDGRIARARRLAATGRAADALEARRLLDLLLKGAGVRPELEEVRAQVELALTRPGVTVRVPTPARAPCRVAWHPAAPRLAVVGPDGFERFAVDGVEVRREAAGALRGYEAVRALVWLPDSPTESDQVLALQGDAVVALGEGGARPVRLFERKQDGPWELALRDASELLAVDARTFVTMDATGLRAFRLAGGSRADLLGTLPVTGRLVVPPFGPKEGAVQHAELPRRAALLVAPAGALLVDLTRWWSERDPDAQPSPPLLVVGQLRDWRLGPDWEVRPIEGGALEDTHVIAAALGADGRVGWAARRKQGDPTWRRGLVSTRPTKDDPYPRLALPLGDDPLQRITALDKDLMAFWSSGGVDRAGGIELFRSRDGTRDMRHEIAGIVDVQAVQEAPPDGAQSGPADRRAPATPVTALFVVESREVRRVRVDIRRAAALAAGGEVAPTSTSPAHDAAPPLTPPDGPSSPQGAPAQEPQDAPAPRDAQPPPAQGTQERATPPTPPPTTPPVTPQSPPPAAGRVDARPVPGLSHVRPGQRWVFTGSQGDTRAWTVTRVSGDGVTYDEVVRDPGGEVRGRRDGIVFTMRRPEELMMQHEARLERKQIELVRLDCVVVTQGSIETWIAMDGELETFPGIVRYVRDGKVSLELTDLRTE